GSTWRGIELGGGESDTDHLTVDVAQFMRAHDVLVPPATIGRTWSNILAEHRDGDAWSVIEQLKVNDPVDDPDAAAGFFLMEGIVSGYTQDIEAMLAREEARAAFERIPSEYATRRLVNLLNSGQAQPALALARLAPNTLHGLRNHPLFPKCLEQFFSSVIAREDEVVREEALQTFSSFLGEDDVKNAAAEAAWQILDPYQSTGSAEVIIRRFGLNEADLAAANSRHWMTSRIFNFYTLENPLLTKEVFERYAGYPELLPALEDSVAHHVAKQKASERWRSSNEEQSDPWVEKITKSAQHKELCWSLRMGRVEEVTQVWDKRETSEEKQKEYREAALLGFRELCARGFADNATRVRELLKLTEEETSPLITKIVKELVTATYFDDARRIADTFQLSENILAKALADNEERFIHDGDPQLVMEMRQILGLATDEATPEKSRSDASEEAKMETESATPDVLHETIRFYVNESLIAAGKKLREKFARRGLSVPFRAAMAFEPVIQAAEQEIRDWQKHVREILLSGVVTEMIRNQNQVEDPEHTIVEDYDNGSYEDAEAWRLKADDTDVRRVLRQSVFRYGLAGWWPDRGGKLWQRVSEIALGLFSPPFPNARAVDEAYDLVHHRGTFLVQPEDIAAVVLDIKRKAVNALDMLERSRPYMDAEVFTQLKSRLSSMEDAERMADRALAGY
ncbi:hypothetical protein EBT31_11060, partial [bacterium]|nr:hypothetical protein [bacterium]